MTNEHKHAELLRLAADNKDQLFTCDGLSDPRDISCVLTYPDYNWRPVKPEPKKIKRWLWADKYGVITNCMYTDKEIEKITWENTTLEKLIWSETIFEVNDEV